MAIVGNMTDTGYDLRDLNSDLNSSAFWASKEGRNKICFAALDELFNKDFMPMTALHLLTKFYRPNGFDPLSESPAEIYLALKVATWCSILNKVNFQFIF